VSLFDDIPASAPKSAGGSVIAWTQHETMAFEKELLGFYVTGHPLDAYASVIAAGGYQTIASLGELPDRASFRIAGSILQVDKKFTKKEGKPFAVVFVEDLTATLEVVIWNEVYSKVADALVPGRVIAIQGSLDKRDDAIRATAQKVKTLTPGVPQPNRASAPESTPPPRQYDAGPVVLRFGSAAGSSDLHTVREILATSPGSTDVQLLFERAGGELLRVDAGSQLRVSVTPELSEKLARWRVA
jgi:DNA polymerase-3 subunit alpha